MQDNSAATQHSSAALDDEDFAKEVAVEVRCAEAFAAVQHFEKTHCLALQVCVCRSPSSFYIGHHVRLRSSL